MKNILSVVGPQCPRGTVSVSGAKNSATRLLAAAMLTDEMVKLEKFPTKLLDCLRKADFMRALGADVRFDDDSSTVLVDCSTLRPQELDVYDYPIRTTYLLVAGQLLRGGVARIPYPGGCKLGERKHDLHIAVWESLGCRVVELSDHIRIEGQLRGGQIHFPISTVGGTENALLCGSVASGRTMIYNAYITPEIENLIDLLRIMGARININSLSQIEIEGVDKLNGGGLEVMPDRIEALTWIVFAAITKGDLLIENVPFSSMEIPLIHLRRAGLDFFSNSRSVYVSPRSLLKGSLHPFEVACGSHPGVISDMQPLFTLLALHASGRSMVFDYRYPERTAYVEQLAKIYSDSLSWKLGAISIDGGKTSSGAEIESTDLRGSIALALAAFAAEGESRVHRIDMALRGYNNLAEKLKAVGLSFELS